MTSCDPLWYKVPFKMAWFYATWSKNLNYNILCPFFGVWRSSIGSRPLVWEPLPYMKVHWLDLFSLKGWNGEIKVKLEMLISKLNLHFKLSLLSILVIFLKPLLEGVSWFEATMKHIERDWKRERERGRKSVEWLERKRKKEERES